MPSLFRTLAVLLKGSYKYVYHRLTVVGFVGPEERDASHMYQWLGSSLFDDVATTTVIALRVRRLLAKGAGDHPGAALERKREGVHRRHRCYLRLPNAGATTCCLCRRCSVVQHTNPARTSTCPVDFFCTCYLSRPSRTFAGLYRSPCAVGFRSMN